MDEMDRLSATASSGPIKVAPILSLYSEVEAILSRSCLPQVYVPAGLGSPVQAERDSDNTSNTGARLCCPRCCQSSFQSLPQVVCPDGQTCTRSPAWAS